MFNSVNIFYQFALLADDLLGLRLIKDTIVQHVSLILIKKVIREDRLFSTRLLYDTKKVRRFFLIWLLLNTTLHKTRLINDKV